MLFRIEVCWLPRICGAKRAHKVRGEGTTMEKVGPVSAFASALSAITWAEDSCAMSRLYGKDKKLGSVLNGRVFDCIIHRLGRPTTSIRFTIAAVCLVRVTSTSLSPSTQNIRSGSTPQIRPYTANRSVSQASLLIPVPFLQYTLVSYVAGYICFPLPSRMQIQRIKAAVDIPSQTF